MKILFNNIGKSTNYLSYMEELHTDYNLFRKKHFSTKCLEKLSLYFPLSKCFLTHSATGALEMIALMMDVKEGDEIILPSFTFVSTANAFVSRGAVPVFVDITKEDLNIDISLVESKITPKTRAICAVHYAGHATDLNALKAICVKHNLILIEDAAMSFGNTYKGKSLGSIGDFGVISFDITKQISAIQGGVLIVNNEKFFQRAGHIYHIGTNREDFMGGTTPYYEWVDVGSKFQMNELNAVALYDQLERANEILKHRNEITLAYYQKLQKLEAINALRLMPNHLLNENYHEFYILLKDKIQREVLSTFLLQRGIETMFHYIPLHNSTMGKRFGNFEAPTAIKISDCLLRLPLHTELTIKEVDFICEQLTAFWKN